MFADPDPEKCPDTDHEFTESKIGYRDPKYRRNVTVTDDVVVRIVDGE